MKFLVVVMAMIIAVAAVPNKIKRDIGIKLREAALKGNGYPEPVLEPVKYEYGYPAQRTHQELPTITQLEYQVPLPTESHTAELGYQPPQPTIDHHHSSIVEGYVSTPVAIPQPQYRVISKIIVDAPIRSVPISESHSVEVHSDLGNSGYYHSNTGY